jgi:hypothetical protein
MRASVALAVAVALVLGCSKPEDIVLGPDPLKQMAEQGDQFRRLSEDDRVLLASYITAAEVGKALGGKPPQVTGRTVGEVLADARKWRSEVQAQQKAQEEARAKREAEAKALRDKVLAEQDAMSRRIAEAVTITVLAKRLLPRNYDAGRYSEMLSFNYAIENKSGRDILLLKGVLIAEDLTGARIGELPVVFDQRIPAGKTVKTDTGRGWRINQFSSGSIERIAGQEWSSMTVRFTPQSVSFEGETLQVPEAPDLPR